MLRIKISGDVFQGHVPLPHLHSVHFTLIQGNLPPRHAATCACGHLLQDDSAAPGHAPHRGLTSPHSACLSPCLHAFAPNILGQRFPQPFTGDERDWENRGDRRSEWAPRLSFQSPVSKYLHMVTRRNIGTESLECTEQFLKVTAASLRASSRGHPSPHCIM